MEADNIIAVLGVHAQLPDDYSLLYVEWPPDAESNKSAVPIFKKMVATNLPPQFIHDFTPSGASCWQTRSERDHKDTNLHVFISVGSGTGLAKPFYEGALKPLWEHCGLREGADYAVHYTTSERSVIELTQNIILPRANEGVNQAIVLLSGDGGVVDIVNTLMSSKRTRQYCKPNIALFPMGTGNALAHSLKITTDKTMGIASMLRGHHQPLPLFRATFSPGARLLLNEAREEHELYQLGGNPVIWGAVVCSWGLHAGLVGDSDTSEYRKYGAERFQMAAKEALFPTDGSDPHKYHGRVSLMKECGDGEHWQVLERQHHAYILATLVSNLEQGFTISPASRPLDGQLRLVQFGPMPGQKVMEIMGKAYQGGKHVEDEDVGYEDIEGLKIKFHEAEDGRWRRVCVDGKIIRVEKDGWVIVTKEPSDVLDVVCMA